MDLARAVASANAHDEHIQDLRADTQRQLEQQQRCVVEWGRSPLDRARSTMAGERDELVRQLMAERETQRDKLAVRTAVDCTCRWAAGVPARD